MKEYKTIRNSAAWELIERKSRFISSVRRIYSEDEALEFIKEISDANRDAAHNVFAYIIGGGVELQRASDDGEPQGTAGIPVLEVIKKEGLVNICVVVTRYFGGILLGAGGLIRAYSAAAKGGILEAGICKMCVYDKIGVKVSYTYLGKVQNALNSMGSTIIGSEYTDFVKLYIKVKHDRADYVVNSIIELTNGDAEIEHIEQFNDIEDGL
jgi:uncharacterized YigZ family protein